jgi:hypothetical protein
MVTRGAPLSSRLGLSCLGENEGMSERLIPFCFSPVNPSVIIVSNLARAEL